MDTLNLLLIKDYINNLHDKVKSEIEHFKDNNNIINYEYVNRYCSYVNVIFTQIYDELNYIDNSFNESKFGYNLDTEKSLFEVFLSLIVNTHNVYIYINEVDHSIFYCVTKSIDISFFNEIATNILLKFIDNYDETDLLFVHNKSIYNLDLIMENTFSLITFKKMSDISSETFQYINMVGILKKFFDIKDLSFSSKCSNTCKMILRYMNKIYFSDEYDEVDKNLFVNLIKKFDQSSNIIDNEMLYEIICYSNNDNLINEFINKVMTYDINTARNIILTKTDIHEESPLTAAIRRKIDSNMIFEMIKFCNKLNSNSFLQFFKCSIKFANKDLILYFINETELDINYEDIEDYIDLCRNGYYHRLNNDQYILFLDEIPSYFNHHLRRKELLKLNNFSNVASSETDNDNVLEFISNEYWIRELSLYT